MKIRKSKLLILLAVAAVSVFAMTGCSVLDKSNTGSADSGVSAEVQGSAVQTGDGNAQSGSNGAVNDISSSNTAEQPDLSDEGPAGEIIPDEWADAAEAENKADDVWSGQYISDDESVTVTLLNDETISFSFAQSGISGTAAIDGAQAVFKGDDYHVVVFSLSDTILNIAVSSEEDFDTSESPLNGTYVRQAG